MLIQRKPGAEAWLVKKVRTWLEKQDRPEGWHVSDLLYPRKAYWKRVEPRPLSPAEVGYFVAGQGHHYVLEAMIEGGRKVGRADAGSRQWKGIWYSPDIASPHPIEIKTSRAQYGPRVETSRGYLLEYGHYLRQLRAYCAIENKAQGDLLVFYLNLRDESTAGSRSTPTFRWYRVRFERGELAAARRELLATKKKLEAALKARDPQGLPPCPEWMAYGCPWREQCGCGGPPKADRERVRV